MFTRLRLQPPAFPKATDSDIQSAFEAFVKNDYEFKKALCEHLASLNSPGVLAITEAMVNGSPVGNLTPDTGKFTTLEATGNTTLGDASGDSVTVNGASFDYAAVSALIKGDFSNATLASRTSIQSRTTDGITVVQAIPNGAGTASGFSAHNAADPDNSHYILLAVSATQSFIRSTKAGSGTTRAMEFQIDGTTKLSIGTGGQVAVAGAAVSTTTQLNTPAGTTGASSLRIPHGAAPTAPVDGDMWTTTAGLFARINGATVGPLS